MLLTVVLCLQEQEGSSSASTDEGGKGRGYSDFPFVVIMSVLEDFLSTILQQERINQILI